MTFINKVKLANGNEFMLQTVVPKSAYSVSECTRIVNERLVAMLNAYGGGTYTTVSEDVSLKGGTNTERKCDVTCIGKVGTGDRTMVLHYSYDLDEVGDYEAYANELAKTEFTPGFVVPMSMTRIMYL